MQVGLQAFRLKLPATNQQFSDEVVSLHYVDASACLSWSHGGIGDELNDKAPT